MSFSLLIEQIDDEDYDGNPESYKRVFPILLDGVNIHLSFSYPTTISDSDIEIDVKSKLTEQGYTWE